MFFGSLLVIVLITALVAPNYIEWSNYRAEFEKQAGKVLGQKVEVRGSAKARLFPLPRIEFTDVTVGARENGEAMMVVDRFRVDVELAPLLKGDILIVDMELQNPKVNIAVGKNGVVDWTSREIGGVDPDDVLLEKVTIQNGSIRLHNIETDQSFEAEKINASISARTLAGPWTVRGNLVLNGEKADIRIKTGRLQEKGVVNSRLNIQPHRHPYSIELSGPIGLVEGTLRYKGNFSLRATQNRKALPTGEPGLVFPYEALPVRMTGQFDARPNALKLQEFKLAIGNKDDPYTIDGTAQAAFGDRSLFKIVAEGQQIDVDRLGKLKTTGGAVPSLAERLVVLKNIFERVPVPPAEGQISLYLPAIVAGDTVIREVGVDIQPRKNGWQLSNLEAGLPGRTTLQAHGLLTLGEDAGFKGQLLLASKQPSGFAGWLKGDVNDAIRSLPNAGFSAKVILNEKRVLLQKLEVVLGKTKLKGAFERVINSSGDPSITTILDGNDIDYETMQALFLLFVSDREGGRFSDHNMDVILISEAFSLKGIKANNVAAALKLIDGHLKIDQLEIGDLAGAKISAKGEVRDALNRPSGELSISISAKNSVELLKLMKKTIGTNFVLDNMLENPSLVDDLDLNANIKITAENDTSILDVKLLGEAGGTGVDIAINLNGDLEKPAEAQSNVELSFVNSRPQVLLQQLAIPVLPLDVDGELNVTAQFNGVLDNSISAKFDASIGTATLVGKGEIDKVKGKTNRSRFDLKLNAPDLDPILYLAGVSFPGIGRGDPVQVSANVTSLGSWLSIKNIEGSLGGQKIDAKFTINRNAKPRMVVNGALALQQLPLEFIAGLVMGEAAIENGVDWSNSPFTLPALQEIDGAIKLSVGSSDMSTSIFGYAEPGKNLKATLELNDGDITIRDAQFDWLGGHVNGEIAFSQNQSEVLINSKIQIENADIGKVTWVKNRNPFISGQYNATINAEGSGSSIAKIVANLAGSGTIAISDGVIQTLNPSALPAILRQADLQKEEELETAADSLIGNALNSKPFEFTQAEAAFSIAGGNVRASNVVINAKDAKIDGDLRIDLVNLAIDGNARILFDAGEDALTGATPEVNYVVSGSMAKPDVRRSTELFASFLSMRARERKEQEYETQKEDILETQRLTRMVRLYKGHIKQRRQTLLERESQERHERLTEESNIEEQNLRNELKAAEDKAQKARDAIQKKQSEDQSRRATEEKRQKQQQLEITLELERQRADLKRRQEAFDKLLREQKAANQKKKPRVKKTAITPKKAPELPSPREIEPTGSPQNLKSTKRGNLPGVFDSVEDRIGNVLQQTN